jgi:large subunit ribosomal protein L30
VTSPQNRSNGESMSAQREGTQMGAEDKKLKVTLVKGVGCTRKDHRATVRGLGLKRIRQVVELEDTKAVRGMINKVSYLVSVVGE